MQPHLLASLVLFTFFMFPATSSFADETAAKDQPAKTENSAPAEEAPTEDSPLLEGHSIHGEVFNEGPRQAAYLMPDVGKVVFPATSKSEEAKAFVVQGVAQLHGFWYFESERSFRQAAMLDPDCAIAYWGMAMSNRKNTKRAQGFIKEAVERKKTASRQEQLYIDSFDKYINAKADSSEDKKKRSEKYLTQLEDLSIEFPDDLEVKAFICEFLWSARREGLDTTSYLAIDALIQEILDAEPLHPAHHYRIHLWDTRKAELALESAARCGLAAPAIAHMWHMPGHIYSRLKRYNDAVYQQEASARVDHAHMMKDLVLPDQIHNFAHNNEWCIRNMIHIGRVSDAIDLARNMTDMPRHPKYNDISKSGSYKYGRQRLLDVLRTYELHDQIIALSNSPYLEDTGNEAEDLKTQRYIASAYAAVGDIAKANEIRAKLEATVTAEKEKQTAAAEKAVTEAKEAKKDDKEIAKAKIAAEGKFRSRIRDIEKAIQEIDGRLQVREDKLEEGLVNLDKAGGVPLEEQVMLMVKAGKTDDAVKKINDHVRSNGNEVRPLAAQVEVLFAADKKEDAKKAFEALQKLSSEIDMSVPVFARLTPIAEALGLPKDWKQPATILADIGARPPLDSLGPLNWQPVAAKDWSLANVENNRQSLSEFRGKPVVVIFYLGAGCLHCAEQLQKFAPMTDKFTEAGFEVVAISTDKQEVLNLAYKDLDKGFSFPLLSDADLTTFKAYRCFDDFESKPLHGTFIIDGNGKIRWQDISYEPFMDPQFVLDEGKRLLGQDKMSPTTDDRLTASE